MSPILGVPLHILHMGLILKELIFVDLLIRPYEFKLIPWECHCVKSECHHISSNSEKFPTERVQKSGFGNQCHHNCHIFLTKILVGDQIQIYKLLGGISEFIKSKLISTNEY